MKHFQKFILFVCFLFLLSRKVESFEKEDFGPLVTVPSNLSKCSSLLVVIHGLGDRGDKGWLSTMKNSYYHQSSRASKNACVLLPTAKKLFIAQFQQKSHAWFDLPRNALSSRNLQDEAGFDAAKESVEYILKKTEEMKRRFNLKWNQVIFSGFSQGAAMSIVLGLMAPEPPAGIVSMGGFLPVQEKLKNLSEEIKNKNSKIPFLFLHGEADQVVKIERAKYAIEFLKKNCGVEDITLKTDRNLGHSMNDEMFKEFFSFVDEKFERPNQDF
jgi:lysophospholipase-1